MDEEAVKKIIDTHRMDLPVVETVDYNSTIKALTFTKSDGTTFIVDMSEPEWDNYNPDQWGYYLDTNEPYLWNLRDEMTIGYKLKEL